MTEISAASPNKEKKEQEISMKEFMKTQKQFMENMQLMFQKHASATSTAQSSGPYEKYSNVSQQESYDRYSQKNPWYK